MCPKITFCGARKVRIIVCKTVATLNTGAASNTVLIEMYKLEPGRNTMKALRLQDKQRLSNVAQKSARSIKNDERS